MEPIERPNITSLQKVDRIFFLNLETTVFYAIIFYATVAQLVEQRIRNA